MPDMPPGYVPNGLKCSYCGASLYRQRFESSKQLANRKYCSNPTCLAEAKRAASLEAFGGKEDRNERIITCSMVNSIFIYAWGMEPFKAFDRYGDLATESFCKIKSFVESGAVMKISIVITAFNPNGEELAIEENNLMLLDPDLKTEAVNELLCIMVANAARVLALVNDKAIPYNAQPNRAN